MLSWPITWSSVKSRKLVKCSLTYLAVIQQMHLCYAAQLNSPDAKIMKCLCFLFCSLTQYFDCSSSCLSVFSLFLGGRNENNDMFSLWRGVLIQSKVCIKSTPNAAGQGQIMTENCCTFPLCKDEDVSY